MTNKPRLEMRRMREIADPIARQFAEDYNTDADPMRVWTEQAGALAFLLATLLEPMNQPNEAAARATFIRGVDVFLKTLRQSPTRPRQP